MEPRDLVPRRGEGRREEEVVPCAEDMRRGEDQQLVEVGRAVTCRSVVREGYQVL